MATHWGTWSPEQRRAQPSAGGAQALPPEAVAEFIAWVATAPAHLVLDEAIVTPLGEQGYP
jgi:NADP-dependent 3-hydroxy acid dehydrogenase YdfG